MHMVVLQVEISGHESPKTTLRTLEEDPMAGKHCLGTVNRCLASTCHRMIDATSIGGLIHT